MTPSPDYSTSHDVVPDLEPQSANEKAKGRPKQISVVVLSKDEPELAATLELLRPQCEALDAECIVVDASEHRLESIRQANSWVSWIDYSGPFWRSSTIPHQRNAGCHAAEGDVIAFCDAGGEPVANWLETITAPLLNGTYTMVCGPVYAKKVGVYSVINDLLDGEVAPSAASGNMAFLKTVIREVDGFEEGLFYGSDVEFTWRCASSGHPCYQVRAAQMTMDFGSSSLTMRRAWRYGRPFVRLWDLHPELRVWMIKNSPERVIYPLWILFGPISILAAIFRKLRWAPFAWLGVLGLLLARNRKAPGNYRVVANHIVGGASTLNEVARRVSGDLPPVIFIPDNRGPYLRRLSEALKLQGTPVSLWSAPTKSASINLLLGPLWIMVMAWRGVKIIHIHWTYTFSPSSADPLGRLARWWFDVFLASAHAVGIKIVWTAHNLLPHEAVFDDDMAARKALVRRADAIIALTPQGAREVAELFEVADVTVIPLGTPELPASLTGRESMRRLLGVDQRTCCTFFGYLRPYKGLETLIAAAERVGRDVVVVIIGQGEADYVAQLVKMVAAANAAGADVRFTPRWHSENELADLLAASDVCVFPFVHVDNSGSILLAHATGLPTIIPDLSSLRHIDNPGVLWFDHANPVSALTDSIIGATKMDHAELATLGRAAQEWAREMNWSAIAEATAAVYAKVVRQK